MAKIILFRWYGGKARMVDKILAFMPKEFDLYIEPFMGSAAVFFRLNNERYKKAILNDKDKDLVHLYRILKDEIKGKQLVKRLLQLRPYENLFVNAKRAEAAGYNGVNDYKKAEMIYTIITQSFNALRTNYRHGMIPEIYARQLRERLPFAQEKLVGVQIENMDGIELIKRYAKNPKVFMLVDSPYLHDLRGTGADKAYYYEMDYADHVKLLLAIREAKAKIMLCGYHSYLDDLYDQYLLNNGWRLEKLCEISKACQNRRGESKDIACEYIWLNY